MARIYFADDEDDVRSVVTDFLRGAGYEVEPFSCCEELLDAFRVRVPDLVILDIMMPGMSGIEALRQMRARSTVPVIMLTAKDGDEDYYTGLSLGADDYLTKPFRPLVLAGKVQALLRRVAFDEREKAAVAGDSMPKGEVQPEGKMLVGGEGDGSETACGGAVSAKGAASGVPGTLGDLSASISEAAMETPPLILRCGNLVYDEKARACAVNGRDVPLTPTELRFLRYCMERFGEAVKKEDLLREIWGFDGAVETRVVDETNRRVRKKLAAAGSSVYIQTIWGYGLKLVESQEL